MKPGGRKIFSLTLEDPFECRGFIGSADQKHNNAALVEKRQGKRDPFLRNPGISDRHNKMVLFVQGRVFRKKRRGVSVLAHAENDQIECDMSALALEFPAQVFFIKRCGLWGGRSIRVDRMQVI